jgi:hypothetical protein
MALVTQKEPDEKKWHLAFQQIHTAEAVVSQESGKAAELFRKVCDLGYAPACTGASR